MNKDIKQELEDLSKKIRLKCLDMAYKSGNNGSHLGGGLSLVEVLSVLYHSVLKVDANNSTNDERDRLIISKGHCVLPYYSLLNEFGFIPEEELVKFETNGAILHGHATRDLNFGIEFSGGSLSLGISFAVGVALAGKRKNKNYHVYTIVGDGECNEGLVWEAIMSASHFKLDNLTIIVDNNKLQYDGKITDTMNMGNLQEKFEAFGCNVFSIDGHNVVDLYNVFFYGK